MFEHNITIDAAGHEITLSCNGKEIGRSARALILQEPPLVAVYYIPRDDIYNSFLEPSDHKTTCPFKGDANYFNLNVDGERFENAAWSYEAPNDDVIEIKDFIAFLDSVVTITEIE